MQTSFTTTIYTTCVKVYKEVVLMVDVEPLAATQYRSHLREELNRLQLWGSSFRGTELDSVLGQSDELNGDVLSLIAAIRTLLMTRGYFKPYI